MTRKELEDSIAPMVGQAKRICLATLDEVGLEATDHKGVILVGGATRMPCISESVRLVFGTEPIARADVDEVVALEAALNARTRATCRTSTRSSTSASRTSRAPR